MKITSKEHFFELCKLGLCGNTPRIFNNIREAVNHDGYLFVSTKFPQDRFRIYNCLGRELDTQIIGLDSKAHYNGLTREIRDLQFTEAPGPSNLRGQTFQFDYWPAKRELAWDMSDLTLGEVRRAGKLKRAYGLSAIEILKYYLIEGLEQLNELSFSFPDAIIEATQFNNRDIGIYSRNLLIWEVRDY